MPDECCIIEGVHAIEVFALLDFDLDLDVGPKKAVQVQDQVQVEVQEVVKMH
jgi:hypothetical protein